MLELDDEVLELDDEVVVSGTRAAVVVVVVVAARVVVGRGRHPDAHAARRSRSIGSATQPGARRAHARAMSMKARQLALRCRGPSARAEDLRCAGYGHGVESLAERRASPVQVNELRPSPDSSGRSRSVTETRCSSWVTRWRLWTGTTSSAARHFGTAGQTVDDGRVGLVHAVVHDGERGTGRVEASAREPGRLTGVEDGAEREQRAPLELGVAPEDGHHTVAELAVRPRVPSARWPRRRSAPGPARPGR